LFGSGGRRGRIVVLGAIIACLLAAGTAIVLTQSTAQATGAPGGRTQSASVARSQSGPLRVLAVTPAAHAASVNGAADIKVTFSARLAAGSPMPALQPAIAGTWQRSGDAAEFTPARGFGPGVRVQVRIPGGPAGVQSASGGHLAASDTVRFRTGRYSSVRLAQVLAQLGYLPLTWTAASGTTTPATAAAQRGAAFAAPAGAFSWKPGYPARLHRLWQGGRPGSLVIDGAIRAFEAEHGMTMDGVAGPAVWRALLAAAVKGQANTHGYTYAVASQKASPETLTIWHNGHVVFRNDANTGIPASLTDVGTFPVYLRYQFQIMRGTNPDGSKYADPVSWVSYFSAGDAVHYFPRYSYGSQQSLGCVELPYGPAKKAWPYLTYGSLVTVTPL